MICCLPFTYYSEESLRLLTTLGQPIVLVYPTRRLIPQHLQADQTRGVLDIRTPAALDENHLEQVLAEYRSWADLHQGNLDGMAGFFSAEQAHVPFIDETDPSQIHTQLRRFGMPGPDAADRHLMQAAVFMAMAHEFDSHQDALSHELEAISRVEQQMFKGLAGEASELQAFPSQDTERREEKTADPGLYLTEKRLQAWAALACAASVESFFFLTTSKAVYESLCDALAQAVYLLEWPLAIQARAGGASLLNEQQWTHLQTLAHAQNGAELAAEPAEQTGQKHRGFRLVVHGLPACPPATALRHLAGRLQPPEAGPIRGTCANTLFGYLELSDPDYCKIS